MVGQSDAQVRVRKDFVGGGGGGAQLTFRPLVSVRSENCFRSGGARGSSSVGGGRA